VVAVQWNSIWVKHRTPDPFRSEGICRRKEGSRGRLGQPPHPLVQPGLARTTRWCGPHVAPLRLILCLRVSSGKIGYLQYFQGFFLKLDICTKTRHQGNSAENSVSLC
jgi:hypothetical protein